MCKIIQIAIFVALAGSCSGTGGGMADGGFPDADTDTDSDTDCDSDSDPDPWDGGTQDPPGPHFDEVGVYQTLIPGDDDPADVYHPAPPDLDEGGYSFPVALLLQGAEVGRQHYSAYATAVASYGFIVVVPDHQSISVTGPGLYAEQSEAQAVMEHMIAEGSSEDGTVSGAVDAGTLVLLGHSYGGVAGVNIIRGVCEAPTCVGLSYDPPPQLAGGAFWGTNVAMPFIGTMIHTIDNRGLPLAFLQGTLDSKALPQDTQEAYTITQDSPKAYFGVIGANHYGICDADNPPGASPDPTPPTLSQEVATETAARWSALFLRAHVLDDGEALDYVTGWGGPADPNVNVCWE